MKKESSNNKKNPVNKPISRVQAYSIKIIHYEDGTIGEERVNDGFNALELLGIMERTQLNIMEQLGSKVNKPDIVKRTCITD